MRLRWAIDEPAIVIAAHTRFFPLSLLLSVYVSQKPVHSQHLFFPFPRIDVPRLFFFLAGCYTTAMAALAAVGGQTDLQMHVLFSNRSAAAYCHSGMHTHTHTHTHTCTHAHEKVVP